MKKLQFTFLIFFVGLLSFAQNHQAEFDTYFKANDTLNQLKTLQKWQLESPTDAELFTSYFNYYLVRSKRKTLSISKEQPNGESFHLKDNTNQNQAYLGTQIHYNTSELNKGFDIIKKGIELYPNRLDMRFGKIYVHGLVADWDNFTSEIIKTIEHSSKNNNKWTWTNNTAYDGGVEEFLLDIQDYQLQLYNTGNDDLLINIRKIASKVLEYYPNHVESLSNLSITYLLTQQYDKGITYLLKAEKIKPTDYIVLGNIAQAYKLKGNKEKSIEYYKKVVEFGNDQAKDFAKQEIEKLNNPSK